MAEATTNGNRVHAGRDQLARMGVAESVKAYRRQLVIGQSAHPFPRRGITASCCTFPARKDEIAIACTPCGKLLKIKGMLSSMAADLISMNSDSSGSATTGMPTPIIPFRRPATIRLQTTAAMILACSK
jgi:hypothetical protein